jgi:hypothetical protein
LAHERGTDSFSIAGKVQVYFDGIRLGGVETLPHGRPPPGRRTSRYFDGIAATARWGLDHGKGRSYVSTHPISEMVGPALRQPGHAAAEAIDGS